MQKDQGQHDDTNCNYPEAKPKQNAPQHRSPTAEMDYDGTDEYYNSFAMNELSRILHTIPSGGASQGASYQSRSRPNRFETSRTGHTAAFTAESSTSYNSTRNRRPTLPKNKTKNTNKDANKPPANRVVNSNRTSKRDRPANANRPSNTDRPSNFDRSSNADIAVNIDRPRSLVDDDEMDQLLAMHLAHDLSQDGGEVPYLGEDPMPTYDSGPANEMLMLPCEFCCVMLPAESLIHHQVKNIYSHMPVTCQVYHHHFLKEN